jgi:hypothetical protein
MTFRNKTFCFKTSTLGAHWHQIQLKQLWQDTWTMVKDARFTISHPSCADLDDSPASSKPWTTIDFILPRY